MAILSFRYNVVRHTLHTPHDCKQAGETPEQNGPPKSFHSRIDEASNEMLLMVYRPLDYEITPTYTLTIKAAVSAPSSSLLTLFNYRKCC